MTYSPKTKQLALRRNTYTHPVSGAVCLHQQRNLVVRVAAAAFDVKGCTSYYKCSGLLDMTLDPDEEKVVLQLDRSVVFPLSVSVHMALVSTEHVMMTQRHSREDHWWNGIGIIHHILQRLRNSGKWDKISLFEEKTINLNMWYRFVKLICIVSHCFLHLD